MEKSETLRLLSKLQNFQLMPQTRLGKVVKMCRADSLASKSLLTPKKYRIVKQLADDFSERTALGKFFPNFLTKIFLKKF